MPSSFNENPSHCLPGGCALHGFSPDDQSTATRRLQVVPDVGRIQRLDSREALPVMAANVIPFPAPLVFSPAELTVMAELLCNRAEVLQEMTAELVRTCPEGDIAWAVTADQRDAAVSALNKVRNALLP